MGFIKSIFFAGTCLAAAISYDAPAQYSLVKRNDGTCTADGGLVAPQTGGNPSYGTAFCESGYGTNYVPVTGIATWSNEDYITGIGLHYANGGLGTVYGDQSGSLAALIVIDYAQGQRWTGFEMYSDPNTPTLNALVLTNSKGEQLYAGAQPGRLSSTPTVVNPPIGGGILMGIFGTADGSSIRSLAPLFVASPIQSIHVDNMQFPNGPVGGNDGITIDALASSHFYNGQTTGNETWTFMNSEALATTSAYAQAVTNTYGTMETITFGLSLLMIFMASSATAFTWSTAYMNSQTNTVAKTVTASWSESGSLLPGEGVDCVAAVGEGSGTFLYTSTVTINLQSGFSFTYPETGELTIDNVSQAVVTVTTNNNPN